LNGTLLAPNLTTGTPNTTTNGLCHWKTPATDSDFTNEITGTTSITINSLTIPPWGGNDLNCPLGFLHIFPRFSPTSSHADYRKFCGSQSNLKLYIPGSSLQIDYEVAFVDSNFSLSYKVNPCGEFLRGPLNNITSLNYPNGKEKKEKQLFYLVAEEYLHYKNGLSICLSVCKHLWHKMRSIVHDF
jgi:hypothetical protein